MICGKSVRELKAKLTLPDEQLSNCLQFGRPQSLNLKPMQPWAQYGHLSAKLHRQGDCKTFRYKFLRFYFYKEPMGGGVGQVEEPEEKDWQYPHPNSGQSVILKSVCNYVN